LTREIACSYLPPEALAYLKGRGRSPGRIATLAGAAILVWLLAAFGMGAVWKTIFGTLPQP
jgi:hypothetical protein